MKQLVAADMMNPDVIAVEPDMTVHELATFLTDRQISGAPVIDERGRLVGVVSETDIAEADLERVEAPLVREIMTPTAYTIPHDTTVEDVARTMVTGMIHRLLVTRDGHVVGILTTLDVLKAVYVDGKPAKSSVARQPRAGSR
jgi:CBS domain-containing protein